MQAGPTRSPLRLPPSHRYQQLGATLANNGQHARAHECYRRALDIKPSYARGWLNAGISYYSTEQHKDAAQGECVTATWVAL
jgi:tetratricopeptide (TPR) repeat protein